MSCVHLETKDNMDYMDRFVIVVNRVSYKFLFAIGIKQRSTIWQMDIVTVFLYDFLDKNIYGIQP